ncbi:hypothetical protein [Spirabiliibacterium mucosae]|nr:hypothetical protein [Spirabiliibacterium mucosae]
MAENKAPAAGGKESDDGVIKKKSAVALANRTLPIIAALNRG